jgi:hypothetical protein
MLHTDLFYEISLYCKPYMLSVNKELNLLYNDDWFKTKLNNLFPDKKLFTGTNYKDLYKRYLEEGDIYYVTNELICKLQIKGVKAQYKDDFYINHEFPDDYILTFNGELYSQIGNDIKLIDTEVIDVSSYGYIKNNKVYVGMTDDINGKAYISMTDNTFDEMIFHEKLLKIVPNYTEMYILSVNGVYIDCEKLYFYEIKDCIDIIKLDKVYIVGKNNIYYTFINDGFEIVDPPDRKYLNIWEGKISLDNGTVSLHNKKGSKIIETNVKNIMVDNENNANWYYIK